tara:strand:- start:468 stop:1640 length:1173 start_codon:yes stop_codon:yes gene_type:complete
MEKQKICIIGSSLTGLVTALSLSKLNLDIDLVMSDPNLNLGSSRTIAISENNLNFLKKLNIFNFPYKEFWPCEKMKLYKKEKKQKFSKIMEFKNNDNRKRQVLYMCENSKIISNMLKKIKQSKSISIKNHKVINEIKSIGFLKSIKYEKCTKKYNLIILCTGNNSDLTKKIFPSESLKHVYEETSITTIVNHRSFKNNIARQIFLDNEIIALLPISNNKTSIVWSVKNSIFKKNINFIRNKIEFYTKDFLKKINFKTKLEYKNLNFLIRKKYYKNRILLFGDALHLVHPFVGQGFNMTLRDLALLEKTLKNKIELGLDIGTSDVLEEFSNKTKPRNFIYSIGIDLLKRSFSINNNYLTNTRNFLMRKLDNNNMAKNFLFKLADKGFFFKI